MAIHSSEQTIFSLAHVEGITLGAGEVAGGAGGMGVDGIGEVGDWASEGQAAGVNGTGFTAGSLAGKGARGGMRGTEDKVSISRSSFLSMTQVPMRPKSLNILFYLCLFTVLLPVWKSLCVCY